jgi:ribosomal protein S18 acetylase RimI-like enzyme
MKIRLATTNDLAKIIDCVRQAYSKYIERIGRAPAPMLADYEAQIKQGIVRVLTQQDDIRGLLVSFPEDDHYFIRNIAVYPAFQGHGYGKKLMAFAQEQARSLHFSEVRLYTNIAMTENILFYSNLGFEEIGRTIENGYHRVYMRKTLEPLA